MTRLAMAGRVVRATGIVLLAVAAIHFAVTPVLATMFARQLGDRGWAAVGPPFLLNHLVVGVLLVPAGITLIAIAGDVRRGSRQAWWLAMVFAITVASLPVVMVAVIPPPLFQAPAFVIAASLVTVAAVVLPTALVWARPERLTLSRNGG